MSNNQFLKPSLLKILLTIVFVVCIISFYSYKNQQIEALRGISFDEQYTSIYDQCCKNKNPSEYDISYCKSNNLDTIFQCDDLNGRLSHVSKGEKQQLTIRSILFFFAVLLSYIVSCIIDSIFRKIL